MDAGGGMRAFSATYFFSCAVIGFVSITSDAHGAQAPVPDLSGPWGRNIFHFEPPPSGPAPVVNKMLKPNGGMNEFLRVGDYTNPILKPTAADTVKTRGETILNGSAFPNPHNQCWPEPTPFTLI